MIHKIALRCSYLLFGLFCLTFLSACTASDTPQAITPSPSPATTAASPTPTTTLTPTATPTPDWPDPNWGPVPEGALIRLGKGEPMGLAISPDGQLIVVGSHLGVFLYRLDTHEQIWYQTNAGAVDDVAYSPDGQWVAAASGLDVHLMDAESGTLIHSWQVPDDPDEYFRYAYEVAFSPDGSLLASISGNGKIALWDIAQGKMKRILRHESGGMSYPCGIAFSPDGMMIASAVRSYLTIFDPNSGRVLQSMRGEPGGAMGFEPITDVSFSPDGKTVVTGNGVLWDVQSGREILRLDRLDQGLMAFSPDGKNIASVSSGRLTLWDAASGAEVWSMEHSHMYWVNDLQFLPGAEALAVAFEAQSIVFLDAKTGKTLNSIEGHFDTQWLTFSRDSNYLASWNRNHLMRVWDINHHRLAHTFVNAEISIHGRIQPRSSSQNLLPGITFARPAEDKVTSPDSKTLVKVDTDENSISFWDPSSNTLIGYLEDAGPGVAYSRDGKYLATVAIDGSIVLWDPNLPLPGQPEEISSPAVKPEPTSGPDPKPSSLPSQAFHPHAGAILGLAFGSDNSSLTILAEEGVFTYRAGKTQEKWRWPSPMARSMAALSPDGKSVAAVVEEADQRRVGLWDVDSGLRLRWLLADEQDYIYALRFSPDSRHLAATVGDGQVAIWDVYRGQRTSTLSYESGWHSLPNPPYGLNLAFSPDGKILSAGHGPGLILWDVLTGAQIIAETGCRGNSTFDQVFTPDGKSLIFSCGASDYPLGSLSFWDVPEEQLDAYWHECGSIHSLANSLDGEMLALGYFNGSLALWAESGQSVYWSAHDGPKESWLTWDDDGNLIGVEHEVTALAFSPNSKSLASGSLDGSVIVWDVPSLKLPPVPSGCRLYPGHKIRANESTRLWSRPDVSDGEILLELRPAQPLYVLSGPMYGPILLDRSLSGWFWEVSLSPGGESAGWIWQERVQECQ